MFKKKNKTDAPASDVTRARKPASPLQQALLTGVGTAVAVVLLLSLALIFAVLKPATGNQMAGLSQQQAQAGAAVVQQWLQDRQAQLAVLAADPVLIAATQVADEGLEAKHQASQWQSRMSQVERLLLIPLDPALGSARLVVSEGGLRSNIEVDMARAAYQRETDAAPEPYRVDGRWYVSMAVPVAAAQDAPVTGVLLASYDVAALEPVLKNLGEGRWTLSQQFRDSRPAPLLSTGQGDESRQAAVNFSGVWQMGFAPAASAAASIPWLAWVLLVVATLLAAATALFAHRRLLAAVEQEAARLPSAIKALTDQADATVDTFAVPGFNELARKQAEQQRQWRSKLEAAQGAASKKAAAQPAAVDMTESLEILDLDSLDDLDDSLLLEDGLALLDAELPDAGHLPTEIFRAYDIRGLAETQLSANVAYRIGRAVATEARERNRHTVVVGRDGRLSSPMLFENLARGLNEGGCDVIDIGVVPSPVLYFANYHFNTATGVMITGSHNSAPYNGMKIVIDGVTLAGDRIQQLRQRIESGEFSEGSGQVSARPVDDDYITRISMDVAIAQPLKIVVDAGNGAAGDIAPRLFRELGCEVIPLFCDIDGRFPNHHPDPSEEKNLADLKAAVAEHGADLGIAFDGDGDRVGVVTAQGHMVMADRLLMLLAQDIVARNPGADIVFDIKCTRLLAQVISNYGGRPIMWRSGHSHIKEKMIETGALLGGELSGHIFFKERWYGFDDGLYSAARLIEILSTSSTDLDGQLAAFPNCLSTPELKIEVPEAEKFAIIERLASFGQFGAGKLSTIDGVRVDFDDGWGLIRASNTTPCLTLRFEADDEAALERVKDLFREQLSLIDPALTDF